MRVLIRCDGGGEQGVGHVIRSLALAEEAAARGHEVLLAGSFEGDFVHRQLEAAPVTVLPLPPHTHAEGIDSPLPLLQEHPVDVLHVDHYEVHGELVHGLRAGMPDGVVLSNVEDGEFGRRPAHLVVDPTWGSEGTPRPEDGSRWLLRGAEYAAMRRQVTRRRGQHDAAPDRASRVLVMMGGTDPVGLAPLVVRALVATGLSLTVTVIATAANAERVRAVETGPATVTVVEPVDDVAGLIAAHDLVVSAAGTSVWELCCLGAPMALVRAVANQADGYARVVAAGAAAGLGGPEEVADTEATAAALKALLLDGPGRSALAAAAEGVIDGLGAWRIVGAWEQAVAAGDPPAPAPGDWLVREATPADARTLWEWRNDPATRAGSRSAEPVPWESHVAWLESSLTRVDRVLLLVQDAEGGDVGTVRWDEEAPGVWEVSITVATERRGQSLARPLLASGEEHLARRRPVVAYLAAVHRDNAASRRLFAGADYVPDRPEDADGFLRFRKAAPRA